MRSLEIHSPLALFTTFIARRLLKSAPAPPTSIHCEASLLWTCARCWYGTTFVLACHGSRIISSCVTFWIASFESAYWQSNSFYFELFYFNVSTEAKLSWLPGRTCAITQQDINISSKSRMMSGAGTAAAAEQCTTPSSLHPSNIHSNPRPPLFLSFFPNSELIERRLIPSIPFLYHRFWRSVKSSFCIA